MPTNDFMRSLIAMVLGFSAILSLATAAPGAVAGTGDIAMAVVLALLAIAVCSWRLSK